MVTGINTLVMSTLESYSGNRKYVLEYKDGLFAKEISRLTGDGVFLDLGCGDGCFTVPVAQSGTKVIAADISNTMLKILRDKAEYNNVSLENVILCRMNALHILLADNSVDCVVSNSVLHLISRPKHVINEIYRVLKPNGCYVFKDDRPGIEKEMTYDNTLYNNIVNDIYSTYWKILKQMNVYPQKYSWKFDRKSICEKIFKEKEEIVLPVQMEFSNKIEDGFLPRWMSRGFSDQVDVPIDLHIIAISQTTKDIKQKYGNDFREITFKGTEPDIVMTIYRK